METNEVQKEEETSEETVSRKAGTGTIGEENKVLKETMVDQLKDGAQRSRDETRAMHSRGGLMKGSPGPRQG